MKLSRFRFVSLFMALLMVLSSLTVSGLSVGAASAQVITTDAVRLRSSKKIADDNIIATLSVSEKLSLLENTSGGWAYVSRSDGTKGYCSVDYLNVPSGSPAVFSGVTTDDVNFRKGPSTDYDSISVLSKGAEFTVADNSNEMWVKARVNGTEGYIYRSYTSLEITIKTVITETPDWFESSRLEDLTDGRYNPESSQGNLKAELSKDKISLDEGSIHTLAVLVADGISLQSGSTFKSSDTSVATVSSVGTVKAISEGEAVITVTLPFGEVLKCSVKVNDAPDVPTEPTTPTEPTDPEEEIELSATKLTMEAGTHEVLKANREVTLKSSDTSVVTVSGSVITAKSKGVATITATANGKSAECVVTVVSATSGVTIKKSSATVTVGKTYYNGASSLDYVKWTSSDTSVAEVNNGFITGKAPGKAVITASNSLGKKTCLVTVKDAEPIRFAYSTPNTAAASETITLYAVTDKERTEVKFEVTVGSETKTVMATDKITDGNTYVFSGTTSVSVSGTHKVVAYAKGADGKWKTCSSGCTDAVTSIFIRKTADKKTETKEDRRATDEAITLISQFEGYSSSVYFDQIANNIPTLGYGKVIYLGDSFYNDMTKREAYAYLVQTINEDGYTSQLNNYLNKNKLNRNQQQFDGLLSFSYNLGAYILSTDTDFKDLFLATGNTEDSAAKDTDAYINANDVNFREAPTTSSKILGSFSYGTALTLIDKESSNGWYHVKTSSGTEGYVYADYVTKGKLVETGEYSLGRVNKDDFNKLMMQYHHAGSTCVWGLLYRRVDELDVFYHGEYTRNGSKNIYGYRFTCAVNSSTNI